ncbi:hypothetical protein LCGC14_1699470 [marine sediment metagenome]|uniref:Uncharacterized protein n=1 Tax=marine sediment metagenome TaxID=412755 RepID=A0A0F9JZ07_9ZZZZ
MDIKEVKKNDKCLILGFAPDSRGLAPIDDDSFDIWPLNELYMEMPKLMNRATAWFQLHGTEPTDVRDPHQALNLSKLNCPVFMWKKHRDIPNSIEYPLAKIMKEFDTYGEGMAPDIPHERDRIYMTNTISWMIVMAIAYEYKEIHIYGVNMAQDQEYKKQRPSCEMYIGWARGRGIKIYLPKESDLCTSWLLYGYDDGSKQMSKQYARSKELTQRINGHQNNRQNHLRAAENDLAAINQLQGAKENTDYMINSGPVGVSNDLSRKK